MSKWQIGEIKQMCHDGHYTSSISIINSCDGANIKKIVFSVETTIPTFSALSVERIFLGYSILMKTVSSIKDISYYHQLFGKIETQLKEILLAGPDIKLTISPIFVIDGKEEIDYMEIGYYVNKKNGLEKMIACINELEDIPGDIQQAILEQTTLTVANVLQPVKGKGRMSKEENRTSSKRAHDSMPKEPTNRKRLKNFDGHFFSPTVPVEGDEERWYTQYHSK